MPNDVPSRITENDRDMAVKRLQEAFVDGHILHQELDDSAPGGLHRREHGDLGLALAELPDKPLDKDAGPALRLAAKGDGSAPATWRYPESSRSSPSTEG